MNLPLELTAGGHCGIGGVAMAVEAPPRVIPATQPDTQTERRLSPDTLCPDQQSRVVRRILRELP